jgi:hypothetical protein
MLQMFIAVINENFDVAEETKTDEQAALLLNKHRKAGELRWWNKLNPYRWFKANPKAIAVNSIPSGMVLPMQKALVQDYYAQSRANLSRVGANLRICIALR